MDIYVGNLNPDIRDEDIEQLFQPYGKITSVKIIKNFAFVVMPNPDEATEAIKALNGKSLKMATLRVNRAKPRGKFSQPSHENKNYGRTPPSSDERFVNPYNFVQVAAVKDAPETLRDFHRENSHFHHRFRSDLFSGRVVCRLTTETDMFIGGGKCSEAESGVPAKIKPFELNGKPAIAPSSLKGMLSSVMEAASNSALRVLGGRDAYYTRHTEVRGEPLKDIGILIHQENGQFVIEKLGVPVYLNAYRYNTSRQKFAISGTLERPIRDYSVEPVFYYAHRKKRYPARSRYTYSSLQTDPDCLLTQQAYDCLNPNQQSDYEKGIIKHLGVEGRDADIPPTKKHEMFVPYPDERQTIPVPDAVIADFNALAEEAFERDSRLPFTPFGRHNSTQQPVRLRHGDVLYYRQQNNRVEKLSFSACWRDFCGNTKNRNNAQGYFSLVDKNGFLLPPCLLNQHKRDPEELKLTPVCSLMGFVEEEKSDSASSGLALAGRLFFSPGILSPEQNPAMVRDTEKTLKILDSPKPPCPEFYFYAKKNPDDFITKKDLKPDGKYLPRGRKFYWHHQSASDAYTVDNAYIQDNYKQCNTIKPIKPSTGFLFTIDFYNLTKFETGMLLYALKPSENFRHQIGMAKPLGLGRVNIHIQNLLLVDRERRYRKDNLFDTHFFHTQSSAPDDRLSEGFNEDPFNLDRFCATALEKSDIKIEEFVTGFVEKIKELYGADWFEELETIGNPETTKDMNLRYPPNPNDPDSNTESFKWWMRNSGKERNINGVQKTLGQVKQRKTVLLPVDPR